MVDITFKPTSHRTAVAQAIVKVSKQETIDAINNKTVPKGDVFEASRVAGLFAVKRTSDMIPDCHSVPVEFTAVNNRIEGLEIIIETEVQTIYRTGVEVEAMHGASVVALTMYDMLKPIDKEIEIKAIKLLHKKGGKSQYKNSFSRKLTAAVIVCSDGISAGKKQDSAGKAIKNKLENLELTIKDYIVIPEQTELIQKNVLEYYDQKIDLIIVTGGTGVSPMDLTPEAIKPLLDQEIPGIGEVARNYGQERMPYAMLSRSLGGLKGKSLILALPGSTRGAGESMDALFPSLLHIFRIMEHSAHIDKTGEGSFQQKL